MRLQNQAAVLPMKIWAVRIQSFVGQQCDPGCVLAEDGERIIKMVFTIEIRNVRRPQLPGLRALFLDPFRNLIKNLAAEFPLVQVWRTTNWKLPISVRPVRSSEQIPSIAVLNDGGVVHIFGVPADRDALRRGRRLAQQGRGNANSQE